MRRYEAILVAMQKRGKIYDGKSDRLRPGRQLGRRQALAVEPDPFPLDPQRMEEAVTSCTKAILRIHLYGPPTDAVITIMRRHGLKVLEDGCLVDRGNYDALLERSDMFRSRAKMTS